MDEMKINLMKKLLIFTVFLIQTFTTHAQAYQNHEKLAYLIKDSVISYDVKLINLGSIENAEKCAIALNNRTLEYSPDQVKEYGFPNGQIYLSKEIHVADSVRKVFLERLYKGHTTLYYYRNKGVRTFFLEKDSAPLVEVPKYNENGTYFQEQLASLAQECPNIVVASKLVRYNQKSLKKLIERLNTCDLKPFPYFKYGFFSGIEFQKLVPSKSSKNKYINDLKYKYEGAIVLGAFIDQPLFVSDFSIRAELNYSKHGYSYNNITDTLDIDFVANVSSIKLPVLLRYTYPSVRPVRPFVNIGGLYLFNIQNENTFYTTTKFNANNYEINKVKKSSIANNQWGLSVGLGCEYRLGLKTSIFVEARYSKIISKSDAMDYSIFNLLTGINF
jgi:hypothetical protein